MYLICVQNEIIDLRKAYVRFISHELRTPLNSVFMGMQLSIDQIPEDTQEPVELERRETLVETQSACGAALDILNELLLFDKLETGALVLHKLTVPVPELVEDSIKMFSVQTREKSIELTITNHSSDTNDTSPFYMMTPNLSSRGASPRPRCDTSQVAYICSTDEVCVDKNKVLQVIRNVVSNAIKFTPAFGKIQVTVWFQPTAHLIKPRSFHHLIPTSLSRRYQPVSLAEEADVDLEMNNTSTSWVSRRLGTTRTTADSVSGELVIEVKDSGAGISEENQKRLFKEVVQFHPELLQNGGGSGLGMCISKGIMDMHGGSISVFSAGEGQGSVFTLRLPMVRYAHTAGGPPQLYKPLSMTSRPSVGSFLQPSTSLLSFGTPPPALQLSTSSTATSSEESIGDDNETAPQVTCSALVTPSKPSVDSKTTSPLRFLVVDDSKMNRKMLCRLLQNQGHVCTEAEDGVQAVAIISAVNETKHQCASYIGGSGRTVEGFDMILMDFM